MYLALVARPVRRYNKTGHGRPLGVPTGDFDDLLTIARALESRAAADVDAAMRMVVASAHEAVGRAEIGMQFGSAFGRLDDAFAIAAALYFQRGFDPGEVRFSRQEGIPVTATAGPTCFSCPPPRQCAAIRALRDWRGRSDCRDIGPKRGFGPIIKLRDSKKCVYRAG
jgi:hypothetical protein